MVGVINGRRYSIARTKYRATKTILIVAIIALLLLSLFIGLVAYFGQYMGTFVIGLDYASRTLGITLSETSDFKNSNTRLLVNPVNDGNPASFGMIDWTGTVSKDGDYDLSEKNRYIAYTFYLKNGGSVAVDIGLDLNVITMTHNIDDSLRVAIIEDGYINEAGVIEARAKRLYMKDYVYSEETPDSKKTHLDELTYANLAFVLDEQEEGNYYDKRTALYNLYDSFEIYKWTDDDYFGSYEITNFKPGEIRKFSLFIWLEGWDDDCNQKVTGGKLKMNLQFAIKNETEEDEDE